MRSRPRWEKKFVQWLRSQGLPHFLPVYLKTTVSHRKKRTTTLPLFPGYVFVAEDVSKTDLSKSGSVVRLLKPASEADAAVLDRQLYSVWLAVRSGQTMAPLAELVPGQHIEITEGPMRGMEGIYIREGRGGSLILEVDMLSSAIRVGIPPDCRFQIRN